jgi:hypothetical protein
VELFGLVEAAEVWIPLRFAVFWLAASIVKRERLPISTSALADAMPDEDEDEDEDTPEPRSENPTDEELEPIRAKIQLGLSWHVIGMALHSGALKARGVVTRGETFEAVAAAKMEELGGEWFARSEYREWVKEARDLWYQPSIWFSSQFDSIRVESHQKENNEYRLIAIVTNVQVLKSDFVKIFKLAPSYQKEVAESPAAEGKRLGAPPKYDWPSATAAALRHTIATGASFRSKAELAIWVQQYFANKSEEGGPSTSVAHEWAARVWQTLSRDSGK